MNNSTKFEDRASSSPSTHEGEPSESLCDRLSRTRDTSQRQLPTDQDYAVSTREYQTDQSSLKHASTAACPALEKQQKQPQRQKQPHRFAGMDRGTPYQRFCVNRGSGSVAPDFRVTTSALCIDPPFAKLIRGSWFAKVVVMSERSTEQTRELLRSNLMASPGAGANQNFENEEHTCQRFVSRDLVFRWTVLAQG
jgi:hypothetical protein